MTAEAWVRTTREEDVGALVALQQRVYPDIPGWNTDDLVRQIRTFPQGQLVAETHDGLVGCASSLIVAWDDWAELHSWKEITSDGTFRHHNPTGKTLYGAEVFVDPEARGLGVGKLLYEGRRTICRALNLKRIIACGRLPGYHQYEQEMTPEFYAQKVVWGDINDPVLNFQLHEGFSYCGVFPDYIPEDVESAGNAAVIVWLNPDYDVTRPTHIPAEVPL